MSKRILKITGDAARRAACGYVQQAPEGYVVTIAEPTRNLEQSAKFHAMCGDIAKQKAFAGQMRKPEQWKVLLVSGHAIATKQGSEVQLGLLAAAKSKAKREKAERVTELELLKETKDRIA